MIVNTQRLFTRLLARLQINVVCDVGSMNGADALIFRDAVPEATVYAFEPNPENLRLMEANRALQERNIQVVPLAVTNDDGEAKLFLVDADYSQPDYRRGMSSLYQRAGKWAPAGVEPVKTTRLDSFLADKCPANVRLALWIDAEGKAFEVIEGMAGIAKHVQFLHVEVETSACIGSDQKLYPEVKALLEQLGFVEFATDQPSSGSQFNALLVRSKLSAGMQLRAKASLVDARLRYLLARAIRRVCPACLRRYQTARARALSRRLRLP
jgi:FkbM family methyltransferase